MAGGRIWILDGHNVIFAIGALQRLQISGRGAEARALLVERLETFAHQRGEKVLIVFDGRGVGVDPDARRTPLLEAVYGHAAEGAADERILREADRRSRRGDRVTVVTNDRSTLASRLPREVIHLRVRDFWLRHIDPPEAADAKPAGGDFSGIEGDMLALAAAVAAESRAREPGGPSDAARPLPEGARPAPGNDQRRLKKERGRLRQKRRLHRRTKRR